MLFMNKMMLIHKVCWVLGLHRLYHIDLGGPVKKYRVDKYRLRKGKNKLLLNFP